MSSTVVCQVQLYVKYKPLIHSFCGHQKRFHHSQASLVAQMVKNLPAVQETWVRPLGWEDHLAEHMATHSSILAWRIPMDRVAWLQSMGLLRVRHD